MRILVIHSNFGQFGGGEIFVGSFIRLLKSHGNKVFLFSFTEGNSVSDDSHLVIRDAFYDKNQNFALLFIRYIFRFYLDPRVVFRLRRWIRKINPDIIHIHANDRFGISVLIALIGTRIPIVQSVHAYTIVCMSDTSKRPDGELCYCSHGMKCLAHHCLPLWKFFAMVPSYAIKWSLTKRIVDRLIVANPQVQKRLYTCGYESPVLIEHFIEKSGSDSGEIPLERGSILCVGRMSREKGFQYVIRAMVKVRQEIPGAVLHLCGEGPFMEDLKHLAIELHLDNAIIFHGYLDSSELEKFYKSANVVVFPSLCLEICGLVNLEALAYGRPLIICKTCGIRELFQEKRIGFFVDPKDSEALTNSILKILLDRDIFLEMSRNAYELYQVKFSPEIHYQKIISLYRSLLRPT